jgi:hypothetical protein
MFQTTLKKRPLFIKKKKLFSGKSKKVYRNSKIERWLQTQARIIKRTSKFIKKRLTVSLLRKKKVFNHQKKFSSIRQQLVLNVQQKRISLTTLNQKLGFTGGRAS